MTESSIRGFWKKYRPDGATATVSEISDLRDWQVRLQTFRFDIRRQSTMTNWKPGQSFTEDCHYRITKADFDEALPLGITMTSRAMLRDRATSLREANIRGSTPPHDQPAIDHRKHQRGPAAEDNFMVVRTGHDGDMLLFAAGRYWTSCSTGQPRSSPRKPSLLTAIRLTRCWPSPCDA